MNDRKKDVGATRSTEFRVGAATKVVVQVKGYLYQRCPWRRGCGRFWKKSSRQRSGSGSIFFEDIEKLHEFGRISVFTNETP